jgi:hypothetical protein
MSDSKLENESGLIIDPALLVDIRAQCEGRRHELEAAGTLPPSPIAPGSPQSACTTLGAPLPIPAIAPANSAFWQTLLYGNPDGLVSSADATNALRLVAERIGITLDQRETIPTLRAGELRKLLRNKFGQLQAEQAIAVLWRSAPPTPGAPAPAPDQSELPSGARVDSQLQPRWVRALHDPDRAQQEWLSDLGVGRA